MKFKSAIAGVLAASLTLSTATPAMAYDHYHGYHGRGHGGPGWGLIAATGALIGGAALLLTAPIRAVADAPAYYDAPPQQAYAPPQQQYAQPPQYYAQAYAPPPAYYAPAPRYYYGRPAYYAPYPGY